MLVEFTYDLNNQISDVGPIILSEVYRIFEAETVYSVKTRCSAVGIFKSLIKSIHTHVETKQEQSNLLNPIVPKFVEKLILGLTLPNGAVSSLTLKTEIMKVFVYMVNDMPKFIHNYMPRILPPIWHLLTTTADIYVKVDVNEIEQNPFSGNNGVEDEDESNDYQTLILQIFELINSVIESRKFKSIIKEVLTDLTYITILYVQMTNEQVENWTDDTEKFVEDEDEDGSDFSIRVSAHDVLLNLGTEYQNKFLPCLSEAITKHVSVADAEQAAGNPNWWKIHEACMLAVGSFANLILEKKTGFNLTEYLNLVKNLMHIELSPFLSGRCLWVITRFVHSDIFSSQMLNEILDAIQSSFGQERSMVLRISAIRYNFIFHHNELNLEVS